MTNKIYALVGPYASGKNTLIEKLVDLGINYIPVYSTGDPRNVKRTSNLVRYVSKTQFSQEDWMVRVTYKGDYYGIKKTDLLDSLNNNKISITMLDQNGVKQVQRLMNGSVKTIYLMVDYVSLVDRMLARGLNNTDMKYHLEYAESNGEFNYWKSANYIIKNTSTVESAYNQLMAILGLSINFNQELVRNKRLYRDKNL
ncbi:MAG: guanylate kinase [Selenomonadaceae bacterium]|nr:guanylate kinase [Selenomonadaceae bacterium]